MGVWLLGMGIFVYDFVCVVLGLYFFLDVFVCVCCYGVFVV